MGIKEIINRTSKKSKWKNNGIKSHKILIKIRRIRMEIGNEKIRTWKNERRIIKWEID